MINEEKLNKNRSIDYVVSAFADYDYNSTKIELIPRLTLDIDTPRFELQPIFN